MKEISLTKVIILGLVLGMIAGMTINDMAAAETAKSYVADIPILTTIFLRMVKTTIAPLVISTLIVGIARVGNAETLGRIFPKTSFLLICTPLVSIALGLVVVNIFRPGAGIDFVPHDVGAVAAIRSEPFTLRVSISYTIPASIVDATARNKILQIVVFSTFLGCNLAVIGEKADPIMKVLDSLVHAILKLTGYVMLFAPLTVFTTISGLIAGRDLGVTVSAGIFMGEFYLTLGMLWAVLTGLSAMIVEPCIARLTKSIPKPTLLVFTTSSSEAAFPGTLNKPEKLGVSSKITSFVLPIGYSLSLVGSMAYCSFAIIFTAQACNIKLGMGEQITILSILVLASKEMVGVPRTPMVVIAATLNQLNVPGAGLILLMGADPFLDMGHPTTSVMSNAVGTAIVGRQEGGYYGQGYRRTASVKTPEQERPVTETEIALSRQQKDD